MGSSDRPPIPALEILLGDDQLDGLGAEEELLSVLIEETRALTSTPHAEVLHRLLGTPAELPEADAQELWSDALAHRAQLSEALRRPVHIRTALVDLFTLDRGAAARAGIGKRIATSMTAGREEDELTGLMTREGFEIVLGHELRQREAAPLMLALLSIFGLDKVRERQGEARRDEVLAALARIVGKLVRRSDPIARFDEEVLGVLLVGCPPERAAHLVRRMDRELQQLQPDMQLGVVSGLVSVRRGAAVQPELLGEAQELLSNSLRARQALSRADLPTEVEQLGPLSLFATADAATFAEVHAWFARRGSKLLMVKDRATAEAALTRMSPTLLLADMMFPPHGGAELIGWAQKQKRKVAAFLVAPSRWSAVNRGRGTEIPTLLTPFEQGRVGPHLERVLGPPSEPLLALAGPGEAELLARSLAALLGIGVQPPPTRELDDRPELEAARWHLRASVPFEP